jgi:hypothetical protein
MADRSLHVDHSTIARWVLRYASMLHQQIRHHLGSPNRCINPDLTLHRALSDDVVTERDVCKFLNFRMAHDPGV